MKNKLLKIVTLIIILGVIVLGIIFCLVFQLRTENESKKNNAEYNDTNIISFSIKSNIEYMHGISDRVFIIEWSVFHLEKSVICKQNVFADNAFFVYIAYKTKKNAR